VCGHLLEEAFSHASASTTQNYDRLEFLGDSVLDWVVVRIGYAKSDEATSAHLHAFKSFVVNNNTLGLLAVCNGGELVHRIECTPPNRRRITAYAREVSEINPLHSLDRLQRAVYTLDCPKLIGDVVEALIAAVFIDTGYSLTRTWEVVIRPLFGYVCVYREHVVCSVMDANWGVAGECVHGISCATFVL
jgi:endoribonuclease Dicer